LHDRSINVVSALGSGTTFSFQLPVKSSVWIFFNTPAQADGVLKNIIKKLSFRDQPVIFQH
jgi:hypothetical protein